MTGTAHTHHQQDSVGDETILAAFESAGLKNTAPRRLIARSLARHAADQTDFATEELWHQLRQEQPSLGRATLFRSIEILSALGILDRIELGDGSRRYRVCGVGHHHHLICLRCHGIQEVDICVSDEQLAVAAAATGFAVKTHVLEVYGVCSDCSGIGKTSGAA